MLESGPSGSVRGVPSNGHPYRDLGSKAAVSNRSKAENLFDHLVGAGEQGRRDFEAERFGGLELMASPYFVGACPTMVSRQVSRP
jgi:hypothetical protein